MNHTLGTSFGVIIIFSNLRRGRYLEFIFIDKRGGGECSTSSNKNFEVPQHVSDNFSWLETRVARALVKRVTVVTYLSLGKHVIKAFLWSGVRYFDLLGKLLKTIFSFRSIFTLISLTSIQIF